VGFIGPAIANAKTSVTLALQAAWGAVPDSQESWSQRPGLVRSSHHAHFG